MQHPDALTTDGLFVISSGCLRVCWEEEETYMLRCVWSKPLLMILQGHLLLSSPEEKGIIPEEQPLSIHNLRNGIMEWNDGMESWNGITEWNDGME